MLVEPRKSNIHGTGLFALSKIEPGETILRIIGEVKKMSELSDEFISKGCWQGISEDECLIAEKTPTLFRFVNHSKNANAYVDLVSMRVICTNEIKKDTEITIDYDLEPMSERSRKLLGNLI